MNKYIFHEAVKMAMMTASTIDPKFKNTNALTKLIIEFYEDVETFAQMLQFTPDEIENMDEATAKKLISKYID